jgi:enediyne biosynthesis protein E4
MVMFMRPRFLFLGVLLGVILLCGCRQEPLSSSVSLPSVPSVPTVSASARPKEPPFFVDVTEQAGLRYRWVIEGKRPCNILQTIGNGCAFLDYDEDGNLDILLVGSRPALFRGDGKGRFMEVTREAGLDTLSGRFMGCAVGDYDDDGFSDIYLSAYRGGALLHNELTNDQRRTTNERDIVSVRRSSLVVRQFRDVTAQAGLAPQPWGSSCAFLDAEGDEKLDLYVGNYVQFGIKTEPQLCDYHGVRASCGPNQYQAERGVLYRNIGEGKFQDVTRAWGFDKVSGKTLGVAVAPFEGAKQQALALANDQMPGDLVTLRGAGSKKLGEASGMAYAADGDVYGGMGVDWGDYDNDGKFDLVIATYQNQPKCVFRNQGGVFAVQDAARLGLSSSTRFVAFGARWFDVDNDGWLDLMFTNGHVLDNIADVDIFKGEEGGAIYRQPTVLYRNQQGERFEDVSVRLSGGAERPIVGRGLAVGDYDNDGRLDALAVDSEGKPVLMRNVTPKAGRWLLVRLAGRKGNRDGYGAIVTVEAGGRRLVRHCHTDGSYLSASDKRVHFGLGNAARVDRLTVQWPDGHSDVYRNIPVNTQRTLRARP